MAITSKQRAQLRGLAMQQDTIIQVGKGGVTEAVVDSVSAALKARELVKGRVLENSMLTAREACDALAQACRAEQVQVIGTKFVLYKRNEKEPKIVLVKDRKK
ncbi:MAG: YhbY family RNA-binding protein [Eubacteriales bacterium]|nr:YhbY family RNA-binding protein [Eubacteriales bacterium]